jgi:hypothetical protein
MDTLKTLIRVIIAIIIIIILLPVRALLYLFQMIFKTGPKKDKEVANRENGKAVKDEKSA